VLSLDLIRNAAVFRLRCWESDVLHHARALRADGQSLPLQVGEVLGGSIRVLCMGPTEWLVLSSERGAVDLRAQFASATADHGFVLIDVSDGLATLRLQGDLVRELLNKGCGVDLHPTRFPSSHCARTRFAQLSVVVECREASQFELHVGRSHLQYLQLWIADAAAEWPGATDRTRAQMRQIGYEIDGEPGKAGSRPGT
jgi:sarcosine oxidase, subunit gamma